MARKNRIVGCSCVRCMSGRHRSAYAKAKLRACQNTIRRVTDDLVRKGEYDRALDVIIGSGYLD